MPASEGGYLSPVTSNEGRVPVRKRTPNCVLRLIANGQQSTDSFGAGQPIIGRAGFGYSARFTWRVST